jgi:hypothetical protein
MQLMPTDDELRTVLAWSRLPWPIPRGRTRCPSWSVIGPGRLFAVQPSEKSRTAFIVRVDRES